MTNQQVAEQFEIRWEGTMPLIPAHNSNSTLTVATREKKRSEPKTDQVRPHAEGKQRTYSQAMREAIRALRNDGLSCRVIAERMEIPLRSVYGIVSEGLREE